MFVNQKWKVFTLAAALIAAVLLRVTMGDLFFSLRLASSIRNLAAFEGSQDPSVKETKIRRQNGARTYESLIYRPAKSPASTAVILVAGISELGCYHPMLVALSRRLAGMGLMVVAPDISELRNFQITAEPIDQILFWYTQVKSLEKGEEIKKIGLAGISYSGTLALMTAAKPQIRDSVAFVIAIGPYCNLLRCTRSWFSSDSEAPKHEDYPTRFYARWIVMLSALDMIPEKRDRKFLRNALQNLLLQEEVQPPGFDLTAEGLRWFKLATEREEPPDSELARAIYEHLIASLYPQLDPEEALSRVQCPVFLIHGAYDDLIPPEESMEIHRHVPDSYLLISPFLTHTHPNAAPLPRVRKFGAVLDAIFFCYRFSRVVR